MFVLFRPIDSITEYKIDIPDGYEIVSNDQNKKKQKTMNITKLLLSVKTLLLLLLMDTMIQKKILLIF